MSNKYKRSNFYDQKIINNKLECDLVKNYWELFTITRPLRYVTITREFLARPDLLSYSVYRDISYWWILSKFNLIDDWWNDLEVGDIISIPELKDIDDWYIRTLTTKK